MYTLYFIYMHGDKFTPRIYAITDKKELKDSFLSERNPNLFIAKKKKVTQEEKVSIMMNLTGRVLSNRGFVTKDEDGDNPVLGQFQQQSMTPYWEQLKMFAALFAGETGLTLDDLGFASDNPSMLIAFLLTK